MAKTTHKSFSPYYSFIVPVHNEQDNVQSLHAEILTVAQSLKRSFEIIFVDDGSTDSTLMVLKKLKPITIIQLRRNFGQSSALDAGFKQAKGKVIISLDGDRQNDPSDISKMITVLNSGYDVVCGWRKNRQDDTSKKIISKGAKVFRSILVSDGVHDAGCTLRVYRREALLELNLYGEMHRMIPALLRWSGFKVGECAVNHRPRTAGVSKYNWRRTIKGFLDMLDVWFWRKYEARPLHLFGTLGIVLSSLSFIFGLYLAIRRLFFSYALAGRIWPLIAVTGFITGIQLLVFGLLANLIIKSQSKQQFYQIKQVITQ